MNSMQKRKELAKKMIEAMDKRSSLSNKETYAELKAIMEKIKWYKKYWISMISSIHIKRRSILYLLSGWIMPYLTELIIF